MTDEERPNDELEPSGDQGGEPAEEGPAPEELHEDPAYEPGEEGLKDLKGG